MDIYIPYQKYKTSKKIYLFEVQKWCQQMLQNLSIVKLKFEIPYLNNLKAMLLGLLSTSFTNK